MLQKLSAQSDDLKSLLDQGGTAFEDNLLKLEVYYKELNLEEIIESPSYLVSVLITDIDCCNDKYFKQLYIFLILHLFFAFKVPHV